MALLGLLALAIVVAGVAGWIARSWVVTTGSRPVRFIDPIPEGTVLRGTGRPVLAVSPTGQHWAYNANGGLRVRHLGGLEASVITGTEATVTNPFFSPDGAWLGFWAASGHVMKIPLTGGVPVAICGAANVFGASWAVDDTIWFALPEGVFRVAAQGGTPERIVEAGRGERLAAPQLLPGGRTVLFTSFTGQQDNATIAAYSMDSGVRTTLLAGADARYVSTGHLVYVVGTTLFAVPFDPDGLEVRRGPSALVDGVSRASLSGVAHYDISRDGTLVYLSAGGVTERRSLV